MKIYAASDKGIGKVESEDRIIIGKSIISSGVFYTEFETGILAIADGVGGNNAGATASHFIANKLCVTEEISLSSFSNANTELLNLSKQNIKYNGMATTLSGINVCNEKTTLFSVGNTRVYLLQSKKYLKQLTTDDTTLNFLLSTGQISLDEAEDFDRKNEITACFGGGNLGLFKIKMTDIGRLTSPVMITSDGIHDYLSVDQMEDIISTHGISNLTCEAFIEAARNNGSTDDISIILGDL